VFALGLPGVVWLGLRQIVVELFDIKDEHAS
jgi:hypothetical protein